jgi:hypothetical protein
MHNSELFQFYLSPENSYNQITLIEANVVRATDSTTKPPIGNTIYLLLAPICFMIVCGTVFFIVSFLCNVPEKKYRTVTLNYFKQVPCRNCRFFKDNHYLNCAVHPSIVLTKEALNCSDYCSNNN